MSSQKEAEYIQRLTRDLEAGDVYSRFSDFYVFEKVLGTGAFGRVVQVFDKELEEKLALKVS